MVFEPLDFMARLAALVPRPRVHLTRYHGVFAPHSALRAQITPAGRGPRKPAAGNRSPAEQHRAMSWAQRLKRVFKLDLESCEGCAGHLVRRENLYGSVTIAESTPATDEPAGLKEEACRPADPGILGSQGLCSAYTPILRLGSMLMFGLGLLFAALKIT